MYSKICKPEFWCKSKEIKTFRYKTCACKTSLSLLSIWKTFETLLEILIGSQWNRHRKACKYNQLQGLFYHWCVKPGFTTDNYSVDKPTNFCLVSMSLNTMRGLLFVTYLEYRKFTKPGKMTLMLFFSRTVLKIIMFNVQKSCKKDIFQISRWKYEIVIILVC